MTFDEFLPEDAEWKWRVSGQVQGVWTALSILAECLCAKDEDLRAQVTAHLRAQIDQMLAYQEPPGALGPLRALLQQLDANQIGKAG